MDAIHFRQKAARAREMAQSGEDFRLSQMLLEVADDLDAEAEAIEVQVSFNRGTPAKDLDTKHHNALLHSARLRHDILQAEATPIEIINLSMDGVRFRIPRSLTLGCHTILELSQPAIRLDGTIASVCGTETTMIFDPASSADPGLRRLLQPTRAMA